jgi:hypothetical protein
MSVAAIILVWVIGSMAMLAWRGAQPPKKLAYGLLALACWLLPAGSCLLALACWLLPAGSCLLALACWFLLLILGNIL